MLYWCVRNSILALATIGWVSAHGQDYSFELFNPLKNTVYAAVYHKVVDRWFYVQGAKELAPGAHAVWQLKTDQEYRFIVAGTRSPFKKNYLSDREINTFLRHAISPTTPTASVAHLDFDRKKRPLDARLIAIKNNTPTLSHVAVYTFEDRTKPASIKLASILYPVPPNDTLELPLAAGYDSVVLCAPQEDLLVEKFDDVSKITLINARPLCMNAAQKAYTLTEFFQDESLDIKNDTDHDWYVSIYSFENDHYKRLSAQPVLCKAHAMMSFNKKQLFEIPRFYKGVAQLTVFFDADQKKLTPLCGTIHTLHGGSIDASAKEVALSRWFVGTGKKTIAQKVAAPAVKKSAVKKESGPKKTEQTKTSDEIKGTVESTLQKGITGTDSFQITNDTSKAVYIGVYKLNKEKKYARREKPMRIEPEASLGIGFNEQEQVVFSVSEIELKGVLSAREYKDLNSFDPRAYKTKEGTVKDLKDIDLPLKKDAFKKDTFTLREVTVENDTFMDILVARYDQVSKGTLTLTGIIQKIQKKQEAATADADKSTTAPEKPVSGGCNFVLPAASTFMGYASEFDTFPQKIEADDTYTYKDRFKMIRVDDIKQITFKAPESFASGCVSLYNDGPDLVWFGVYTSSHDQLIIPQPLSADSDKNIIPFERTMTVSIHDTIFVRTDAFTPAYRMIDIDIDKGTTYNLSAARVVQTEQQAQHLEAEKVTKAVFEEKKTVQPTKPSVRPKQPTIEKEFPSQAPELSEVPQSEVPITKEKEARPQPEIPSVDKSDVYMLNMTNESVSIRFYYKGFLSIHAVEGNVRYTIPAHERAAVPLPSTALIASRYAVVFFGDEQDDFEDTYSSKKFDTLITEGRAFSVEKLGGKVKRLE